MSETAAAGTIRCPQCGERIIRPAKEGPGMILKPSYVLLGTERRTLDVGCPKCKAVLRIMPGSVLRFRIIPPRKEVKAHG